MNEIVNEWSFKTLEECCDILDNKRVPINSEEREKRQGEIPYYGANGLQGFIDDFIFNEPLILIAEDGGQFNEYATRPIAYRIYGKSWINNHAHVLRAKKEFYQNTIFYSLEHKDIQSYIVGGTRTKLNQSALRQISILIPNDRTEQKKIAEILETIDSAIEQTEALIAKQERIKNGLMHDLLTKGIDEHGNIRSEDTHKFKDSPLGKIPLEWECKRFDEVMPLQRGFDLPQIYIQEGEFPVACSNGIIAYHNKYTVLAPCVWTGRSGTLGKVFYAEKNSWIHNTSLWVTDFNLNIPKFIYFLLSVFNISKYNSGTGVPTLNRNDLHYLYVTLPSNKTEQEEITMRLDSINDMIKSEQKNLKKLSAIKTALMQDLLTGKKRVTALLNETEVMN